MKSLAERIAHLTPKQRELLEKKRKIKGGALSKRSQRFPKRQGEGPWPASMDQVALWFFHQVDPNTTAYNIGSGSRLIGPLDLEILERAFNEIIRRHESLRTVFVEIDGKPYQKIHPELKLKMPLTDLSHLPENERIDAARVECSRYVQMVFDLSKGPLIRMPVLRLKEDEHIVLGNLHHTVTDWWSYQNLFKELITIYRAFLNNRPCPLPDLPIQYVEFALWRNQWYESEGFQKQLDYWLNKLAGAPTVLEIPCDYPRPPIQNYRGSRLFRMSTPKAVTGFREVNLAGNASMLMSTLAFAFAFLYRYTGATDILIGTTVANRDMSETEALIGYLLNTIVIRGDVSGDPSFAALVSRVRTTFMDAYENRDLPFRYLVEKMNPERDLSRSPIYQVEFNYVNKQAPEVQDHKNVDRASEKPMFREEQFYVDRQSASADLQISIGEFPENFEFLLEFNTDLFERSTIDHMADLALCLMEGVGDHPDMPLSHVPWQKPEVRRRLLDTLRNPARDREMSPRPIMAYFEDQVMQRPDAIAVTFEGLCLSYAELDRLTNHLALRLRRHGVAEEKPVGLCFTQSDSYLLGVLAVVKSGGTYLPLDVNYPLDRLAYMTANSGVSLVLCNEETVAAAHSLLETVWNLEQELKTWAGDARLPMGIDRGPDSLIYVMYTSGTTGVPKGAAVTRAGIIRLVCDQNYVDLTPKSVVLQTTAISFDLSSFEMWGAFLNGGRLVVSISKNVGRMPGIVVEEGVDTILMSTQVFHLMVDEHLPSFGGVRQMLVGGDAMSPTHARKFMAAHPKSRLINIYGPTEAATMVTTSELNIVGLAPFSAPIGTPLYFTDIYILSKVMEPQPEHVHGELYIGGAAIGRCYYNAPELTAERFIPNPFADLDGKGSRLYRTGDRVRLLYNGQIEFRGRFDTQVKIRGYRIELGEIEKALIDEQHIVEATLVVHEEKLGVKHLAAYVVTDSHHGDTELDFGALRGALKEKLPDYMVPSIFIRLDELPLKPSGKIDQKALPKPDLGEAQVIYEAPRNDAEEKLAAIWAEVLGKEKIGIHDNFFQLGGDSILVIQVVSRANRAGLRISAKNMFRFQTVAEAAEKFGSDNTIAAEQGPVIGPAPLTPIQYVFFAQERLHRAHHNIGVLLKLKLHIPETTLKFALQALCLHHDALRLRFNRVDGVWSQELASPDGNRDFLLTRVDLTGGADLDARIAAAITTAQQDLSLENGPLVRAVLFETDELQHLFLGIHHLAADEFSIPFLIEDLAGLCEQLSDRSPSPARRRGVYPKTTSWKYWSERLTAYAGSAGAVKELDFWRAQCEAGSDCVPAPDHPTGGNLAGDAASVQIVLDEEHTNALLQKVADVFNARVYETLVAALLLSLTEQGDAQSIRISLSGHGREALFDEVDLSRTAGWFTTRFPLLLSLPNGSRDIIEVLTRVKGQLRAIPNNGIGFGVLRYMNRTTAEQLSHASEPAISFNYLGRQDGDSGLKPNGLIELLDTETPNLKASVDPRTHEIEIVAGIQSGRLTLSWFYSGARYDKATMQRFAERYMDNLKQIVSYSLTSNTRHHTLSDFPLAELTQATLDRILAAFEDVVDIYPATTMQAGMLFHDFYEPDARIYTEQVMIRMRGRLEAGLFEDAWRTVLSENAILRTLFFRDGADLLQVVCGRPRVEWRFHDWRDRPESVREADLKTWLDRDHARGFEPEREPPLRFNLFRLEDEVHQFIWSAHHALVDGWSIMVVLKRVDEVFNALLEGRNVDNPTKAGFRDYVAWLASRDGKEAAAYWRERLAGFDRPNLEGLGRRKAARERESAQTRLNLPEPDLRLLTDFAAKRGLTLNVVIQGAWALLLSRYSDLDDVVYGATVWGRPAELAHAESIVGLFINTLPIRIKTPNDRLLVDWLQELQDQTVDTRHFEDTPLTTVKGLADLPGNQELFESIVVYENYPLEVDRAWAGCEMEDSGTVEGVHYPLALKAMPERELLLRLLYDRLRFDDTFAEAMLNHLTVLLKGIPTATKLGDLSPLNQVERNRLLVEWNAGKDNVSCEGSLQCHFERMALQMPEATAVETSEGPTSYAELNQMANAVACALRGRGVGLETPVGVCLPQGARMIAGLLGILKAGGVYVPLPMDYPESRLAFMIEDTGMPIILIDPACVSDLPAGESQHLIYSSDGFPPVTKNPDPVSGADHLAYIVYTSGTTGEPKGVQITHRNVLRLAFDTHYITLAPGDGMAQVSNTAFDAFTFEVWSALLQGCRICPVSKGDFLQPRSMAAHIKARDIRVIFMTTSVFNYYADTAPDVLAEFKYLLCGGEKADVNAFYTAFTKGRPRHLLNAYGPTESTTFALCHEVRSLDASTAAIPIGRPILKTQTYVLDRCLHPVPAAIPGDLFLAGEGLARGYLNRPELTAWSFVPNPFAVEPGARMYRTGDRVCYLNDGVVNFTGRIDRQVKIRGFRIEPGEIEKVLLSSPRVGAAAVTVHDATAGGKRLAAFVQPAVGSESVTGAELQTYLQDRLPDYMVPSAFAVIPQLPINPNGKLDYEALPEPEFADSGQEYVQPSTSTEKVLAEIWRDVLGVPDPGLNDDFFKLGGHSLMATRVVSRIREHFTVDLPLEALFHSTTLGQLAARVDRSQVGTDGAPPIVAVPRQDLRIDDGETVAAAPMSFAQERLWFIDRLDPGAATYNIPVYFKVEGRLIEQAFSDAWLELSRRHETLRTRFMETRRDDDMAGASQKQTTWQVIEPEAVPCIQTVDLDAFPEAERADKLRALVAADSAATFSLTEGPLLKITLYQSGGRTEALLLNFHHIIADAWTFQVLFREFTALYAAFCQGLPSPLEPATLQYADFAVWQRNWLKGAVLERMMAYWTNHLQDAPPLLELPLDRPRPAIQSYVGGSSPFRMRDGFAGDLDALCKSEGATPFMVLLAGYALLLSRYARQNDVCIGVPVANRNRAAVEQMVGFFVNMLPLRVVVRENVSFRDLLREVKRVALQGFAHQDLPFERLVERLNLERDMSASPVFQVSFALENVLGDDAEIQLPECSLVPESSGMITAKFDITLNLAESRGCYEGGIEYNVDLFNPETAVGMAEHFRTLMGGLAAAPEQPLFAASMLDGDQRRGLLQGWRGRAAQVEGTKLVHRLFEDAAARDPEMEAVIDADRRMTYSALDQRANRLAHHLLTLGVRPDQAVGLCGKPSCDFFVGLLAVLKAGGAYLPLSPEYPKPRLEFMVEDAGVEIVLAENACLALLPQDLTLLSFESVIEITEAYPTTQPQVTVFENSLACCLYTSGTTGRPKGVLLSQADLAHLAVKAPFPLCRPGETMAQIANIAFDAFSYEVWTALCNGGRLVLIDRETVLDGPAFAQALRAHQVDVGLLTTALFNQHAVQTPELLNGMKHVLFGGEKAEPAAVRAYREGGADCLMINAYGPTEAATYVTLQSTDPLSENDQDVPIGTAVDGMSAYVLDAALNPVPAGVPGELFAAGLGLARGYHQLPDKTAESFLPDPYGLEPGSRMYRTGDLVRQAPEGRPFAGSLVFAGRVDHQLKIRGYRIEPAEIGHVLCEHPAVEEALVLPLTDGRGETVLAAYFRSVHDAPETVALRHFLTDRLPEYMVPAVFIPLKVFPLTPNGKIDYEALPQPSRENESYEGVHLPRDPNQAVIASIWAHFLGVADLSADAHFFHMGGHSLMATQMLTRVKESLGVGLPVRVLFENPRLEAFASRVEEARRQHIAEVEPPIEAVPRNEVGLPLSYAQERMWFVLRLKQDSTAYNVPLAFRLHGRLDVAGLSRAITLLVARHESLRTRFVFVEENLMQVFDPPEAGPQITTIDLCGLPAAEVEAHALAWFARDAVLPFDLEKQVFRVGLFRMAEAEHLLMMNMSHIVSDGWSCKVLFRELTAVYTALVAGHTVVLPELPIQYADYAVWQRNWLQHELLESQRVYWGKKLSGAPPALEIPTDRPRPSLQTYTGDRVPCTLGDETGAALTALCNRAHATPFMALMAAFSVLLARYSGQADICVGTPIANRGRSLIEGLIGFFVNTLVIRTDLKGAACFEDLIRQVRTTALDAYANQDVPFEQVVERVQPVRDTSRTPLFQAMFTLENIFAGTHQSILEMPGLTVDHQDYDYQVTKFDLSLVLSPTKTGGFVGALDFNSDLFDKGTAQRIAGHFTLLVDALTARPEMGLFAFPLLDEDEKRRVLDEWNRTASSFPDNTAGHLVFARTAAARPDALALVTREGSLTFAELNRESDRLAHHLTARGVKPDSVVGLCMHRSPEMIIGLLGVLKAGAAYVPIDPDFPEARIRYMIEDARLELLLFNKGHEVGDFGPIQSFAVCPGDLPETESAKPELPKVDPLQLAVVIYTSGSTGRPKGAGLPHRAMIRLVTNTNYTDIGAGDVVMQSNTPSFDASCFEIWASLLNGATLVQLPHRSLEILPRMLVEHRVNKMLVVTPVFKFLVDEYLESLKDVRYVLVGGEAMPRDRTARVMQRFPENRYVNGYGPAENTTFSHCGEANKIGLTPFSVPIGPPVSNTTSYIVDKQLNPVPIGVRGELLIGGLGLARGYLNKPDLTAERFIPNPFTSPDEPGARLYCTGDVCLYLANGVYEFRGRVDHLVKVRGFRIEPGEIEHVLLEHDHVREAVVMAREHGSGERQLVAYVVPVAGKTLEAEALRMFLAERLPDYMIPAFFITLAQLPLTPNRKLDREALPSPEVDRSGGDRVIAPGSRVESVVLDIWRDILGVSAMSVHDNFFELGGHSLALLKVHGRLRKTLEIEVPMVKLFEHVTIKSLAAYIETAGQGVDDERAKQRAAARMQARKRPRRRS